MNKTYTNEGGKIEIKNGIVTASDFPQFCPFGQKPNMDFIRRCGFKNSKALGLYEKSQRKFA